MAKLQPLELFRYRADDFIVVFKETYIGFEITVKKNHKAEFIGFYNVAGYEDGLMTTYKFNSREKCLSHCREPARLWIEAAAKWSASLN